MAPPTKIRITTSNGTSVTTTPEQLERVAKAVKAGKLPFPPAPGRDRSAEDDDEDEAPIGKYHAFERKDFPDEYALLDDLIREYYSTELAEARIGLMWVYDVKPDRDGQVMLGRARLISERERQYHNHDFTIELNHAAWKEVDASKRRAILDHELMHCGAVINEDTGEPTYYIRKHDLEEFIAIYSRHGAWRKNIEAFLAARAAREPLMPLFGVMPSKEAGADGPGRTEMAAKVAEAMVARVEAAKAAENEPAPPSQDPPIPPREAASGASDAPAGNDTPAVRWAEGDDAKALLDIDMADVQEDVDRATTGWVASLSTRKGDGIPDGARLVATLADRNQKLIASATGRDVDELLEAIEATGFAQGVPSPATKKATGRKAAKS